MAIHTDIDWAYLAGIVDGEGSISMTRLGRKGGCWVIVLAVGNCDRGLVEWLHTFGGTVMYDRPTRKPNHRPHHRWTAASNHARAVLPPLLPYLRIKRNRAIWALEVLTIQAERRGGPYTPDQRQRLEELRSRFEGITAQPIKQSALELLTADA